MKILNLKKPHIFQEGEKHQLTWAMVLDLQERISPHDSSNRKAQIQKARAPLAVHAASTLRPHGLFRGDPQGRLPHTEATHARRPTRDTQKEPEVPVTTRTVGPGTQGRKSPEVKRRAPRPSPGDFWEWPRGLGVRKRTSPTCGRPGPEAKGACSGCPCRAKASPAGP